MYQRRDSSLVNSPDDDSDTSSYVILRFSDVITCRISNTYTPLDSIDYSAIAMVLSNEERFNLVDKLADELWSVYHFSWWKLIAQINKHKGLGTGLTYRQYPKDSDQLNSFVDGKLRGDFTHVKERNPGNYVSHAGMYAKNNKLEAVLISKIWKLLPYFSSHILNP